MSDEEYQVCFRDGKAYVRKKPYIYDLPSEAQRQHRARFGVEAEKTRDEFGTTDILKEGVVKEVPVTAASMQEALTGVEEPAKQLKPRAKTIVFMGMDAEQLKEFIKAVQLARAS